MTDYSNYSTEDLHSLLDAIRAELARRGGSPESAESSPTEEPPTVRVSREFGGYNDRRYGKPWIGKIVSWPVGGQPQIEWGTYLGTSEGGEVEIMARVGDIVRSGQKDFRNYRKSEADWFVVEDGGALRLIDASEARKLYRGE